MNTVIFLNTFFFTILSIVWSSKNWLDVFIKVYLIFLAASNGLLFLHFTDIVTIPGIVK